MKYPFIILFALVLLATLFLIFLAGAVWDELRLFVGNKKDAANYRE
jgi:hypothetical protein